MVFVCAGRAHHGDGPQSSARPVERHPQHHQGGPLGGAHLAQVRLLPLPVALGAHGHISQPASQQNQNNMRETSSISCKSRPLPLKDSSISTTGDVTRGAEAFHWSVSTPPPVRGGWLHFPLTQAPPPPSGRHYFSVFVFFKILSSSSFNFFLHFYLFIIFFSLVFFVLEKS